MFSSVLLLRDMTTPFHCGKTAVTISKLQNPLSVSDNISKWERKIITWQTIPVRTHKDQVILRTQTQKPPTRFCYQRSRQGKERKKEKAGLRLKAFALSPSQSQVTSIHQGPGCPSLSGTSSWLGTTANLISLLILHFWAHKESSLAMEQNQHCLMQITCLA